MYSFFLFCPVVLVVVGGFILTTSFTTTTTTTIITTAIRPINTTKTIHCNMKYKYLFLKLILQYSIFTKSLPPLLQQQSPLPPITPQSPQHYHHHCNQKYHDNHHHHHIHYHHQNYLHCPIQPLPICKAFLVRIYKYQWQHLKIAWSADPRKKGSKNFIKKK